MIERQKKFCRSLFELIFKAPIVIDQLFVASFSTVFLILLCKSLLAVAYKNENPRNSFKKAFTVIWAKEDILTSFVNRYDLCFK
jgi:hypothetical protein